MDGKLHNEQQCVIKLRALMDECKLVRDINKQSDGGGDTDLSHRIDSMIQLVMELEREFV